MVTRTEAIESVRRTLDSKHDVVEGGVVELEFGWIVPNQSRRYLETKNEAWAEFGLGATLVERTSGRHFFLPSGVLSWPTGDPIKRVKRIHELGYLEHEDWDLVITRVSRWRPGKVLEFLNRLPIRYVKPEVQHGTTWRVPREYPPERMRELLSHLPCRFNLGHWYFFWHVIEQMKPRRWMDFTLEGNTGYRNEP